MSTEMGGAHLKHHGMALSRLRAVEWALLGGAVILLLYNHFAVCCGQFYGADEAEQLWFTERMLAALARGDLPDLAKAMAAQVHPPLRYWLSMPGLLLAPHSEFGVRLAAIVGAFVMVYQAGRLGHAIGGSTVGWVTALLLAGSAIVNWMSMAFAWSVAVTALLIAVRTLHSQPLTLETAAGRRAHRIVQLCVLVAFLINTGSVLFFAATVIVLMVANWRAWGRLTRALLPWALLYAAYYAVYFVLVPYMGARLLGIDGPFGQLAQNLGRSYVAGLSLISLRENLMGLNAYVLPLAGWIMLGAALADVLRRERMIALWLAPFALAWSLWLTGGAQQYFLWVFVCLLPFGVRFLVERTSQRRLIIATALLLLLMSVWNFVVFLRPYGSAEHASLDRLLAATWSDAGRRHNLVEPYAAIGAALEARLGSAGRFVFDGSTAFVSFYFKDDPRALYHSRYAGPLGDDPERVDTDGERSCLVPAMTDPAIVAVVTAHSLCPEYGTDVQLFPGSRLRLSTLTPDTLDGGPP